MQPLESTSCPILENTRFCKTILHSPNCKIPLILCHRKNNDNSMKQTEVYQADEQIIPPCCQNSVRDGFIVGSTVKYQKGRESKVAIITKAFRVSDNSIQYEIRPLNSENRFTVNHHDVDPIQNDPSDILHSMKDIDKIPLRNEFTDEQLDQLWTLSSSTCTLPTNEQLALYWHNLLNHAALVSLRRLAQRGIIPACIKTSSSSRSVPHAPLQKHIVAVGGIKGMITST